MRRRFRLTPQRLEANRANLVKARAQRWAPRLKHGFFSRLFEHSLPWLGESLDRYRAHVARFEQALAPSTDPQRLIVRALARVAWLRLRVFRVQAMEEALRLKARLVIAATAGAVQGLRPIARRGARQALALALLLLDTFDDVPQAHERLRRLRRRFARLANALLVMRQKPPLDPSATPGPSNLPGAGPWRLKNLPPGNPSELEARLGNPLLGPARPGLGIRGPGLGKEESTGLGCRDSGLGKEAFIASHPADPESGRATEASAPAKPEPPTPIPGLGPESPTANPGFSWLEAVPEPVAYVNERGGPIGRPLPRRRYALPHPEAALAGFAPGEWPGVPGRPDGPKGSTGTDEEDARVALLRQVWIDLARAFEGSGDGWPDSLGDYARLVDAALEATGFGTRESGFGKGESLASPNLESRTPNPEYHPVAVAAWERLQVYRRQAEEEERELNRLLEAARGVLGTGFGLANLASEIPAPESSVGSFAEGSSLHGESAEGSTADTPSLLASEIPALESSAGSLTEGSSLYGESAEGSTTDTPSLPRAEVDAGEIAKDSSFPTPESPAPASSRAALLAGILALYAVPAALVLAAAEHKTRLQARLYRWCRGRYGRHPYFDNLQPDSCWTNPRRRDAMRQDLLQTPPNSDWGLNLRRSRRKKAANGEHREP